MDTVRIPVSGDPFYAAAAQDHDEDHPHACVDGLVYLTYTAFDEEVGDEVEHVECIPCRRCAEVAS